MRGLAALALLCSGCLAWHQGAMPGEPTDGTWVEVEGARVRYLDVGQGPAVVLLHGFASSLETWDPVIPRLKEQHRVLAIDLKGFGWTDRPEGDYSPEAQAALVRSVMNARGIDKAALVGHSWGASVALAFALANPDRVTRLALYDAWAYEEQLPVFFHVSRAQGVGEALFALYYAERSDERMAQAFYDPQLVSEPLVEAVEKSLERPGTRAAALAGVRGMHYAEAQPHYRQVTVPVLLLWGREDKVTPLRYGERLLRDLPTAKLEVYPKCGHFPMLEAAESHRDLVRFLGVDR